MGTERLAAEMSVSAISMDFRSLSPCHTSIRALYANEDKTGGVDWEEEDDVYK